MRQDIADKTRLNAEVGRRNSKKQDLSGELDNLPSHKNLR